MTDPGRISSFILRKVTHQIERVDMHGDEPGDTGDEDPDHG
jgi:hypothetical protein